MQKYITIILLIIASSAFCVFDDYEPSARARGLAGAYYTLSNDAGGVFYNPAGTNFEEKNTFEVGYTKPFANDFQTLLTTAISYKLPDELGTVAFGRQGMDVEYENVDLIKEEMYVLSHSFTLAKDAHSSIDFGYSGTLYNLEFDSQGSETNFGFNIGAIAMLHQRTKISVTVNNLNNPKVAERHDIPQKMVVGIAYMPYDGVTTVVEMQKSFGDYSDTEWNNTEWHGGAEVKVAEPLTIRCGVRNNPSQYSAGATFSLKGVGVTYAFQTHAVLNSTHHVSLSYKF